MESVFFRRPLLRSWLNAFVLLLLPLGGGAAAQELPAGTMKVVVPYPPGAGTDTMARALTQSFAKSIVRTVVVENRAGANGAIGIQSVISSAPDGLTMLFTPNGPIVVGPHVASVPYDVRKDLAPVARVATGVFVLVANPAAPFKTLDGLIDYAKKNPGKVNFASAGIGSQAHLNLEMLAKAADIKVVHVPYRGGGPAAADLIAGHVQVFFESLPIMLPHIRSGALVPLGVTSPERNRFLPEVPAIVAAHKDFDTDAANPWYAIFAPTGTPEPLRARLSKEWHKAFRDPETQRSLPEGGFTAAPDVPPAEFGAFVSRNFQRFGDMIKTLDIKAP